jgi:hypothetical protein
MTTATSRLSALIALVGVTAVQAQDRTAPLEGRRGDASAARRDCDSLTQSPSDLTPGYVLIGDIQVPCEQYLAMIGKSAKEATFGDVNYWSNIVPYDFVTSGDGAVSPPNRSKAIQALSILEGVTGLDFRPATDESDRIRFQNSDFNSSPVGRQGGTQIINIYHWDIPFNIVHELFHSLGFHHEQSRPDRDEYVTIHYEHVCGHTCPSPGHECCPDVCAFCTDPWFPWVFIDCSFAFDIVPGADTYGDYDYDSVMHYGVVELACDGITIEAPEGVLVGQRDHLSYWDELALRGLYPYDGDVWIWRSGGVGAGSFTSPHGLPVSQVLGNFSDYEGSTLFFKDAGSYPAVGTYSDPAILRAPLGAILE